MAPGLCPEHEVMDPENAEQNAAHAMKLAEDWLDVPMVCVCACVCMIYYVCVTVYVCVYVYMYVCMYVCAGPGGEVVCALGS